MQERSRYLDCLIDPSTQGVNKFFLLLFENNTDQTSYKICYLPQVAIKNCNVVVDWWKRFHQPAKNNLRIYDNIRKIATGQGDDYTTGCLLDYHYLKNDKMIAIDLSKQQELDADPNTTQQINFKTQQCFSLLKNQKKPFYFFHKELWKHCECILQFILIYYSINIKCFNITLV